ncbi:MAG: succinate dehydrogenase assembly factor 2 [Alphaproteobacteria bacterium]
MTEPITTRRKRLVHRSRYRGCREADLIFGRFADAHVNGLDREALDRYEALIEESDQDLLAWLTGREPVPERHDNDIFDLVKRFNVNRGGSA